MEQSNNTTPYYNLPLFTSGDSANFRDKWNRAMSIIDQRMHIIENKANENR